jgi:hypothetical protein
MHVHLIHIVLLLLIERSHQTYVSSSTRLVQLVEVEHEVSHMLKSFINEHAINIEQVNMYKFEKINHEKFKL